MKFGIELECYNATQTDVVTAIRDAGLRAEVSSYSGRNYSVWQIKLDGSIQGNQGFEVVSPTLEGEAGIEEAVKVCQILSNLDAKVNKSCGFHIHHDATGWGVAEFRYLAKRFVKFEAAMDRIMPLSRRGNDNRYIKSMYGWQDNKSALIQKTIFKAIDACRSVNQIAMLFNNDRYMKLNFQSFFRQGTVEFRQHSGTTNARTVENWIRFTAGLMADAKNHVAVKPFAENVVPLSALDLMISGMKRRNAIGSDVASFYKSRAQTLTQEGA